MTPIQLKNLFRTNVRDEATPYLWSDLEIYMYMDDAQKRFCREGGGIADSSSAICSVDVPVGATQIEYDPRILKLRDVRRMSDGQSVTILNFEDLGGVRNGDDYGNYYAYTKFIQSPRPVREVVVGMDMNKMTLPAPADRADTLRLIVYRLPLEDVTETSALEIDTQHHFHLLHWMQHLAYSKQDAETYDRGRASEFYNNFMEYCRQSREERERREHKYRTVGYGGI